MEKIKRKFSSNQLFEKERKKLRNEFNQSINSIEHFSNELFYEIFDYLDNYEIYEAFSNLNYRFQQLLNSSSLLFKIKLNYSKSKQLFLNNYQQFLRLNKHKIISIQFQKKISFSLFTINSSLNHLKSLFIQIQQSTRLNSLIIKLTSLPTLLSLIIQIQNISGNLNDIYQLVFLLPVLKTFKFIFKKKKNMILLPIDNKQLSTIEYLNINHSLTFNELYSILSYTPQLRRLNLIHRINIDTSIEKILPITLSNLTNISISMFHVNFTQFEIFIKNICCNLKVLHVSIRSQDTTFLNARRWERFILKSLSQLEEFDLKYNHKVDDLIYPDQCNKFTSSFWIERRWISEMKLIGKSIIYLICPYRKRWYQCTQDNIDNSSSLHYSESIPLTIPYNSSFDLYQLKIIDTKRILSLPQIHHLEISGQNISINLLIELLHWFPALDTLKIDSLSLFHLNLFNCDELIALSLIDNSNEIRKVYLKQMNEIEEIDFLLEFCPYMEYLKIDYIKYIDFKFVLRYIIQKLQLHSNEYLRSLCFCIPTADDQLILKLKRMLNFEKLIFNYTIYRQTQYIYLQWK